MRRRNGDLNRASTFALALAFALCKALDSVFSGFRFFLPVPLDESDKVAFEPLENPFSGVTASGAASLREKRLTKPFNSCNKFFGLLLTRSCKAENKASPLGSDSVMTSLSCSTSANKHLRPSKDVQIGSRLHTTNLT